MFEVIARNGAARAGILHTDHGDVPTPVFMPVGTQGSVKALAQRDLREADAHIILGNTYHLYLRPGADVLERFGGLHAFMSWDRAILTDSGGYQVFSLSELRRIEDKGVTFKSHLDGSTHEFTPEQVVAIQRSIGSDIIMVLDECTPYPCDREYAGTSLELTTRWAERSREELLRTKPLYGHRQLQFGIVQGSVFEDLRQKSARALRSIGFDGYAIGGLAVGEPLEEMYRIVSSVEPALPADKPRYLMGVGTPENLVEAVARGIDMFDCVLPTRNGRNGQVFTSMGTLNLRNASYKEDKRPIDERCLCHVCTTYTRAYLRHLFTSKEVLALNLASLHNVTFYLTLMREMRASILESRFPAWKEETLGRLATGQTLTP
ncbi:MAG: tRNA guanosine(34) transglycosylase Tgt [Ignavibacteria bacterium RIFCSPLOWO2_12_FULL_56_21]|nr:MAG: tRNA guanosine(34) transglycosylase Tgt [Ignavibacteria bacterium GWC2_56_12]OGU62450.1 MAG: tRNA guanosine(34) transglycosylase Tgt [Ignavibacteria bacterium RIFCSPHIGHO2_02_FULL_56_12]OGU73886.1 MAG: tRNA guanosine(34) transglycosylase Tgt [Ignavibacteria bacterium RIFCSPLOWO2_12_FULL_56_21]HAV24039.1 tRNA guanosine(34) transglycosylase Tgt [Bacteroidota bacterium]